MRKSIPYRYKDPLALSLTVNVQICENEVGLWDLRKLTIMLAHAPVMYRLLHAMLTDHKGPHTQYLPRHTLDNMVEIFNQIDYDKRYTVEEGRFATEVRIQDMPSKY